MDQCRKKNSLLAKHIGCARARIYWSNMVTTNNPQILNTDPPLLLSKQMALQQQLKSAAS
jgi:hypothetical protein